MQLNKCSRCGCFFTNNLEFCPNCQPKDNLEMNKLQNFLENSNINCSIENISYNTGISIKNLNRYFSNDNFINFRPDNQL